jgi:hypothetical protein
MAAWQETYPAVHAALAPAYRELPEEQAEQLVRGAFGEAVSLADAEGFFDDLGHTLSNVATAVAPIAQRALPGLVSGAAGGAGLGPLGMLGGALLGGLSSALGAGQSPATAARPAPMQPRPGAAPIAPGVAPVPQPGPPPGAVAQLLAALGSPTVQQALNAMLMGAAGTPRVAGAGGAAVPVAGVTNLLGMLANRASAEWEAVSPSNAGHAYGEGLAPALPEARAAWRYEQLLPADTAPQEPEAQPAPQEDRSDDAWIDELYDDLEFELIASADNAGDEP